MGVAVNVRLDNRVMWTAAFGLISPDAINLTIKSLGPLLDAMVRLGQFAVAVATVCYIYKKWKTVPTKRRKRTQ